MKIQLTFHIRHWVNKSLLALGTSIVIGYMTFLIIISMIPIHPIMRNPVMIVFYAAVYFTVFQIGIFRKLLGRDRGEFEYDYMWHLVDKKVNHLIFKNLGVIPFLKYYLDEKNEIGSYRWDILKKLLQKDISESNDSKYAIYVKLASLSCKEFDYSKAANYLKHALEIRPDGLLANFKAAEVFELENQAENALNSYQTALNAVQDNSPKIAKFISKQIERIKTKGPKIKPPIEGIKYNFR